MTKTNNSKFYITDTKTIDDWYQKRDEIKKSSDSLLWLTVYNDFFYARLESRYFGPIKLLQKGDCLGEGFAITALHCSMIEFLESTYRGINYKWVRNKKELKDYEYSRSGDCFVDFLTTKYPFNAIFNKGLAEDFYSSVRCGILHEASTKNGWRVWASSHSGKEIVCGETKTVFRDDFQKALLVYIRWYQQQLIESKDLQSAFIRKFNAICN